MKTPDPLGGKVALVTGGAVRVGRAISEALLEAGCRVLVHCGRSIDPATSLVDRAQAAGREAAVHQADLQDPAAAQDTLAAAVDRFGRVDVLVNNAAIFLEGDLAAASLDDWDRQMAINLRAPFLLSQAFAAHIRGRSTASGEPQQGQIVNILDARHFRPAGDHFAYRVTKAGLYEMTRMMAVDLAPEVRTNAVALGAILAPPGEGREYLAELAESRIPLRHPGSPEQVAQNVVHLLTQPFLTGVIVRLDGGEFL